jgi:SAM-dependent methyltransferase
MSKVLRWLREFDRRLLGRIGRLGRSKDPVNWPGMTPQQAFSQIYDKRAWGGGPGFYSGIGSHDPQVVNPYVAALRHWMAGRGPLDAVDLGCGDFHVGGKLRPLFRNYIACDVVPALIESLKAGPHAQNVDFRCMDLAHDPLPPGDLVFIRQVLQHLPNAMILALLPKLAAYRWLVLTEHLPAKPGFKPNLDKPLGPDIRLRQDSGVDLCAAPFDLVPMETQVLCEARQYGGLIRTTVYRLQD